MSLLCASHTVATPLITYSGMLLGPASALAIVCVCGLYGAAEGGLGWTQLLRWAVEVGRHTSLCDTGSTIVTCPASRVSSIGEGVVVIQVDMVSAAENFEAKLTDSLFSRELRWFVVARLCSAGDKCTAAPICSPRHLLLCSAMRFVVTYCVDRRQWRLLRTHARMKGRSSPQLHRRRSFIRLSYAQVAADTRFFKTLTDQVITVELKNDLCITGTLKSVDQ